MTLEQVRPIDIEEAIKIFYENPDGYCHCFKDGKEHVKNAVYRLIYGSIPVVIDLSEYTVKEFIELLRREQLYTQDTEKQKGITNENRNN